MLVAIIRFPFVSCRYKVCREVVVSSKYCGVNSAKKKIRSEDRESSKSLVVGQLADQADTENHDEKTNGHDNQ